LADSDVRSGRTKDEPVKNLPSKGSPAADRVAKSGTVGIKKRKRETFWMPG
jgi:hypothetical protein